MSDSEAETEDSEPSSAATQPTTTSGNGGSDFLTDSEKDTLQEWVTYVAGVVAAVGVAIALNSLIQDQWDHSLIKASGSSSAVGGGGQGAVLAVIGTYSLMFIGLAGLALFGAVVARNVSNENQTAYKVAAASSIVGLPILLLISLFGFTMPLDNYDPEFVNIIVSGLGAGIAAAIGSAIVVWLTEEQAPDALQ